MRSRGLEQRNGVQEDGVELDDCFHNYDWQDDPITGKGDVKHQNSRTQEGKCLVEDDSFQRSSALLSDDHPSRKVYPNPTEFAREIDTICPPKGKMGTKGCNARSRSAVKGRGKTGRSADSVSEGEIRR